MSNGPETNSPGPSEEENKQDNTAENLQQDLGSTQDALDPEAQQSPENEAIKTDDKEILGQSVHLRRSLHDATRSFLNGSQQSIAGWKNELSKPRNDYLEWRSDAAKRKYERKQEKLGTSHFKFINKHHERVANAYRARYDKAHGKLKGHSAKMDQRIKSAEQASLERDERFKKRIDLYVNRKIRAERNKLLRKLAEEQKQNGMSKRIERHRFIRDLPESEKRRITKEAIAAIRKENIKKGKLDANYVVPE